MKRVMLNSNLANLYGCKNSTKDINFKLRKEKDYLWFKNGIININI